MLREELRKTKAMEKDLLNEVDEILYDMDSNNNNNGPQKVNPVFSLQKALSKLKMIFFFIWYSRSLNSAEKYPNFFQNYTMQALCKSALPKFKMNKKLHEHINRTKIILCIKSHYSKPP